MKKNYFGKFFAIAMVFAGLSLTSCDKNDNAIINGQVWEPSSTQLVDGGAIVNADTPSEISRMIGRLRQDIIKAAQNKETFTITIDATAIKTTAADNTISFLTINNGDLVVNFTGNIITDEPLVLQSKGVDENQGSYGTAIAKVAFNFPAGTSDIDLKINMPKATVTLKPTSGSLGINELSAKTAKGTLNIESGVTVNWLMGYDGSWLANDDGYVVVKDGAQIKGIASTSMLQVQAKGIAGIDDWWSRYLYKDSIHTTTPYTDDDFYYVKTGKILKNEDGELARIYIFGSSEEIDTEVDITISDGAKAYVNGNWSTYSPAVNITGEGSAKIMNSGYEEEGKYKPNGSLYLQNIKKLSDVTVDAANVLVWNSEAKEYEEVELEEGIYDIDLHLPQNAENCEFITIDKLTDPFWYTNTSSNLKDDIVSSTFKNCKVTFKSKETTGAFIVSFPKQTEKRTSFKLNFDTCELNNVKFATSFNDSEYDDFKAYIVLDNSKLDGKAITKSTDMINYVSNPEKASTFFTIDGTNYKPVKKDGKWVLEDVE